MTDMQDDNYLKNKKQAARYLGISEGGIERAMRRGLPYVKVGGLVRFRPEDLTAYVEAHTRRAAAA